jgi:hypothetical protein
MSSHCLIGVFEREQDVLAAVRRLHQEGLTIADVQTPYAVHGLDQAAGMRRTRLGWVCAIAGLSAAVAMLGFQSWVSAAAWPINVGGKPFVSTPAFVPVMFEVGVLVGGLSTVAALLIISRLYPGKKPSLAHPGVTDDRFVVLIAAPQSSPERGRAAALCRIHNAVEIGDSPIEEMSDAA